MTNQDKKDEELIKSIMDDKEKTYSVNIIRVLSLDFESGKDPLKYLLDNKLIDYKKIDGDKIYEEMKRKVNKDNFKSYQEFAEKLIQSGKAKTEMKSYHKILNKFGFYKDTAFVHGLKEEIKKHENIAKEEAAKNAVKEAKKTEAKAAEAKKAEAKAAEDARIKEAAKKNLEEVKKKSAEAKEAQEARAKAAEKEAAQKEGEKKAKQEKQKKVKAFIGGYINVLNTEFKNIQMKEEIDNLKKLINSTKVESEKERLQATLNAKEGMYELSKSSANNLRRDAQEAAKSAGIPKEVVEACERVVEAEVSFVNQVRERNNSFVQHQFINTATENNGLHFKSAVEAFQAAMSVGHADKQVKETMNELQNTVNNAGLNQEVANSFIDIVGSELNSMVLNDEAARYEKEANNAEKVLGDQTLTDKTREELIKLSKESKGFATDYRKEAPRLLRSQNLLKKLFLQQQSKRVNLMVRVKKKLLKHQI